MFFSITRFLFSNFLCGRNPSIIPKVKYVSVAAILLSFWKMNQWAGTMVATDQEPPNNSVSCVNSYLVYFLMSSNIWFIYFIWSGMATMSYTLKYGFAFLLIIIIIIDINISFIYNNIPYISRFTIVSIRFSFVMTSLFLLFSGPSNEDWLLNSFVVQCAIKYDIKVTHIEKYWARWTAL